jgi:D-beta-D-heptose 7-phosphate kinase/D-beta-D-heptose 1-phosphate adenosyltransferase
MTDSETTQPRTKYKILLLGDDCIDIYQYGTVDRISPEAPVPVFTYEYEEQRAGMAGNVKANLEALGCDVSYMHGDTSIKTRLIERRSKQHIVRIDTDADSNPIDFTIIPPVYDAVVISDYNKGSVSYELIEAVRKNYQGPIFIDTKKTDLARLEGCYVKVNQLEHSLLTSWCSNLIITLGAEGASYLGQEYPAPKVEVSDVCGAGDTFLAAMAFEYINTKDMTKAIEFAIKASAITVQHLGVYAPQLRDIK